jgi:hypothetical protein
MPGGLYREVYSRRERNSPREVWRGGGSILGAYFGGLGIAFVVTANITM